MTEIEMGTVPKVVGAANGGSQQRPKKVKKGGKNQTEKSGTRTRVENMVLKCVVFVMGSFMVYTW